MTTETAETKLSDHSVGAASHGAEKWHSIDWAKAHRIVRRLQARIVKATQAGKRGKVKALQRLLTHSFSGKALAVKRVTENQGKRTPGVDGKTWNTPQEKAVAIQMLRQRGYHPKPLRRIYIPKSNGGKRPLSIPCMSCRAMQALYLLALDPVAETTADPNSYGCRKERSPADAIEQCFKALGKARSPQWILEGDIKACFDKISHDWLLTHIPMDKSILRKWLKAGFMEKQVLHPTEEGTPQGGICSPVIANLALDGLERKLLERYPKPKTGYNAKVNFVRFADDFIVTGISKELLEQEVKPLVEQFMRERGLTLSAEKTVITHIEDGFDAPSPKRTQVPRQAHHQALPKERLDVSEEGTDTHQDQQTSDGRKSDRTTQPTYSRMGELSPARREQSHLCQGRPRDLQGPVAMGQKETPQQIQAMDQGALLQIHHREKLGLLRTAGNQRGRRRKLSPAPGICPYQTTCENQGRSKSLRSRLGSVF
jgi:group II intron reverse transcriptase/maturase